MMASTVTDETERTGCKVSEDSRTTETDASGWLSDASGGRCAALRGGAVLARCGFTLLSGMGTTAHCNSSSKVESNTLR